MQLQQRNNLRLAALALILGAAAFGVANVGSLQAGGPDADAATSRDAAGSLAGDAIMTGGSAAAAPATSGGFYSAAVGSEFVYDMRLSNVTEMAMQLDASTAAGQNRLQIDITGQMQVVIVARRGLPAGERLHPLERSELWVSLRCEQPNVSLRTGSEQMRDPASQIGVTFQSGCIVRMTCCGRILGYRFGDRVHQEQRNLLRALFTGLRLEIPDVGAKAWSTQEADVCGMALLDHQVERRSDSGLSVRRDKRRYAVPADVTTELENVELPRVEGGGSFELDAQLGFVRRSVQRECCTLRPGEASPAATDFGLAITNTMTVQCTLIRSGQRDGEQRALQIDGKGGWAPAHGMLESRDLAAAQESADWARRLEGVRLPDLVQEILELLQTDQAASEALFLAREKLSWLLRLHPDLLPELHQYLAGANADTEMVLLGAVGAAQVEPAQTFLMKLAADAQASARLRQTAGIAMFQIERPVAGLFLTLATILPEGPAGESETDIGGTALLLLGTLAARADGELRDVQMRRLVDYETKATQSGRLADWLAALGNSGAQETVPVARRYIANERADLRAAAVESLRDVHGIDADATLSASATGDPNPDVRRRAAVILAARSTDLARQSVKTVLDNDADERVRNAVRDAMRQ